MSEPVIEAKKYNIDFIKETFSENYAVNSGQNFGKKWTFKNMSNETIPRGTLKFAYEGGEYFNVQHGQPEPVLVEEVKPFSTFDVTVKFIAPANPGHYASRFKLFSSLEPREPVSEFVYCDIQVNDVNDVSVLFSDLMDINKSEDSFDFDARMNAVGSSKVKRAPRESMAIGAEISFNPGFA